MAPELHADRCIACRGLMLLSAGVAGCMRCDAALAWLYHTRPRRWRAWRRKRRQ